jgi:hypothetical protein
MFSDELRQVVRSFVGRTIDTDELRVWLDTHAQAVMDSADRNAQELFDQAWSGAVEVDMGNLTVDQLRTELASICPPAGVANAR